MAGAVYPLLSVRDNNGKTNIRQTYCSGFFEESIYRLIMGRRAVMCVIVYRWFINLGLNGLSYDQVHQF